MSKQAAAIGGLVLLAIAGGFVFGFAWGQGTRSALAGATKTTYSGGVLDVQIDTRQAVTQGLASIFGG